VGKIILGWKGASKKVGGRSIPQLKRDVKAGRFPAPIELGPNSIGWFEDWLDDWLLTRPRRRYGFDEQSLLATNPRSSTEGLEIGPEVKAETRSSERIAGSKPSNQKPRDGPHQQ
jgi:predicted DNA-binding transcriptional regulator AlpA